MTIKVLGSGCANCKLHEVTEKAIHEMGLDATLLYVTDMKEIAASGLLRTPGLIIDNVIVSYGRVTTVEETKAIINNFIRLKTRYRKNNCQLFY